MQGCVLMHCFFFFNDTATTEIYTLSLHDALQIWTVSPTVMLPESGCSSPMIIFISVVLPTPDRKSTRLNSSHVEISYAVFCLKKKKVLSTIIFISIYYIIQNE